MQHIVWFKKDLRVLDHLPLYRASKQDSVLAMYVLEPSIWTYGDLSKRHLRFVVDGLQDVQASLQRRGSQLYVTIAEMPDVLDALLETYGPFTLYSHREHGLQHTYERDQMVRQWITKHGCLWHESSTFAVARTASEHPRATFKEQFLDEPIVPVPSKIGHPTVIPALFSSYVEALASFELPGTLPVHGFQGGEQEAVRKAKAFFTSRYKKYNVYINKPGYSVLSSSHLSPYLTWGNISIKSLQRAAKKHLGALKDVHEFHHAQLSAFHRRLQWHCSFVQAAEHDPNLHLHAKDPAFEGVRLHDNVALHAFATGTTGIPLVDACMLSLNQTGWINFKQRAMLTSFACNTLLLDWKDVGLVLSSLWYDYEPGIHWFQLQLQTGLIPNRHIPLYDVIKQSKMHDPEGTFIKTYIPALATTPLEYLHEPWLLDVNPYVTPLINYREAFAHTKELLYSIKSST